MPVCLEPRCPVVVESGRCHAHAKGYDLRRGSATARGYDRRWQRVSQAFRVRFPLCGMRADGTMDTANSWCAKEGRATPNECVQHIEPFDPSRGQADPRFWNQANWMSSCQQCNNRRRALEPGAFGRRHNR